MNTTNMNAYQAQINLKLLDDIISFVANAATINYTQKAELRNRCIFPLSLDQAAASAMQQEYGFLYLGELLERYEERFGMTPQDRRAIALALGYTRDIATPEMFIGNQRTDFIQSVRRCAENDLYLTGALYLIQGGESASVAIEKQMKEWTYTQTEGLIFTMSLFPDPEQAFIQFGGQLVELLGTVRTLPVFGNTDIFIRAIAMLYPLKKRMKARCMDLLRALLSLPVSFVKKGSKHHGWLLERGYSPIEIVYLNTAVFCSPDAPGGSGIHSLTAEKLVVELFRTVLIYDKALPDDVYEQLSQIYQRFSNFDIKCCGEHKLVNTLHGGLKIQTPETMTWFIRCTGEVLHPATAGFDIMEPKWDALAGNLPSASYRQLFESCLTWEMDAAQIQERMKRYQSLTQRDYLSCYSTEFSVGRFSLLVKAGVIDLWAAFQSCLSENGGISDSTLLHYIQEYCGGINTVQAFEFLRRFMQQYGYQGKNRYLNRYRHGFEFELWDQKSYGGEIILKLQRDFLADDPAGQRLLLHWVDEYFFSEKPDRYLDFVTAVLKDENAAALFSLEDGRGIFDVVVSHPQLSTYNATLLKQRYLTPEELQAEQKAKDAEAEEKKVQEQLKLVRNIEDNYASLYDGTVGAVAGFLSKYRFYGKQEKIARNIVYKGLGRLLQDNGYTLNQKDMGCFLRICGELADGSALDWAEFQSCILKVKEVKRDDPVIDPDK